MKFEYSLHALERMKARGISAEDVKEVLENFDIKESQDFTITVFSKIMEKNNKLYLYRVFVNEAKKPSVVITVYRTTKIEKYGR
jgi:hypothetical protein